ncbi:MAG: LptF/LptG family permease [Lentisphaeria bacterium]|nr:LptF/LptG family permease [Lentisphaeria bacterium]
MSSARQTETGTREDAGAVSRRVSSILFWYISREFLLPLGCCLIAFAALFLVRDVFDVLGDFLEAKEQGRAVLGDFLRYFALQLPVNLPNVLPMSVLLAASFMVGMLTRHHELTALRAGGLSLLTCGLPIWLSSLALSGVVLLLSECFAPGCEDKAQQMLRTWTESEEHRAEHTQLAFSNPDAHRDWFFESFHREGRQSGVLVKQFRPDNTTEWELRAAWAIHANGSWAFHNGLLSRFDPEGRLPIGEDEVFEIRRMPDLDETPLRILNQLRPVDELSVARMLRVMEMNPSMPPRARSTLVATIWFRLTFPLSCLIGALLGVGMTIRHERTGVLGGFALAVGLMVVYYVASHVFLMLGRNGYVPCPVGGALPTLLFLVYSAWGMYRKR